MKYHCFAFLSFAVCNIIFFKAYTLPRKVKSLIGDVEKRCTELGYYIINTKATVRQTAAVFGISKSTVHNDVTKRLASVNPLLCSEVKEILDENKAQRHIRGGMATKEKYSRLKEQSKSEYRHNI